MDNKERIKMLEQRIAELMKEIESGETGDGQHQEVMELEARIDELQNQK